MSITAFAAEPSPEESISLSTINQHKSIHNAKISAKTGIPHITTAIKILSDLNGDQFELIELGEQGYMIFDPKSGKYLEEALDSPSPYLGRTENLYYFGPLNYYQRVDGKFVHTVIHGQYDISYSEGISVQNTFDAALQRSRSKKDTEMLALMEQNPNSITGKNSIQAHFSTRASARFVINK